MPNYKPKNFDHLSQSAVAGWIKRYQVAARAFMEATLRPHDVGSTQWYVLRYLAKHGPTVQREFLTLLQVEKPSLSEVVGALVRKGLVEQSTAASDQRQRLLTITEAGLALWENLPDPIDTLLNVSFHSVDAAELETVARVLQAATERLNQRITEGRP